MTKRKNGEMSSASGSTAPAGSRPRRAAAPVDYNESKRPSRNAGTQRTTTNRALPKNPKSSDGASSDEPDETRDPPPLPRSPERRKGTTVTSSSGPKVGFEDSDDELPTIEHLIRSSPLSVTNGIGGVAVSSPVPHRIRGSSPVAFSYDSDDDDALAPSCGDAVLARYKGSVDKRYYPARITKIEGSGRFTAEFWDGSVRKLDRGDFFLPRDQKFASCKIGELPDTFLHDEEYVDEALSTKVAEYIPELLNVLRNGCHRLSLLLASKQSQNALKELRALQTCGAFSSDQWELIVRELLAALETEHPDPDYKSWEPRDKDLLVRAVLLPEFCKRDVMAVTKCSEEEAEVAIMDSKTPASVGTGTAWVEQLLATRTLYSSM